MYYKNISQPINIPESIKSNIDFLRSLARTRSERKRKRLIKQATPEQLLALVEISLNIVKSCFTLTTRQRKRLLPYADAVRRLARLRTEQSARKFLVQRGGGIITGGLLSALLTPIVLEIISKRNE